LTERKQPNSKNQKQPRVVMGDNGVGATAPPQADEQQMEDSNNNLVELQETVSRISAHKGIESVVIWKKGGDIVYSSQQPQGDSAKKAAAAQRLLQAAEDYFSGTNDDDETSTTTGVVSFVQVKTTSGKELLISPDQGFVLAVAKR
jgi:predicted regulator of Ras-like GTPase activity (Roadblock/LC7/MglB family)